jgi:ribosomal protein L11 methylase PrmA
LVDEGLTSGPPDDEGLTAGDTWIELSVRADLEAVEAVSEILSRFAPGGTSVQPGFELIDEGLGARIDPNQPAIVRAYLPGRDRTAARLAVRQAREALGHLQAFNLRPIGELDVSVVHEADWAQAWKAHFPVLRIGRRLVIRPTWRRHRRRRASARCRVRVGDPDDRRRSVRSGPARRCRHRSDCR